MEKGEQAPRALWCELVYAPLRSVLEASRWDAGPEPEVRLPRENDSQDHFSSPPTLSYV